MSEARKVLYSANVEAATQALRLELQLNGSITRQAAVGELERIVRVILAAALEQPE